MKKKVWERLRRMLWRGKLLDGRFMRCIDQGWPISAVRDALDHYPVDVNYRDARGNTPLMIAAFRGRKDVVRLLLERGADVNAQNLRGFTPLMLAIVGDCKDSDLLYSLTQFLLENSADPRIADSIGQTAYVKARAVSGDNRLLGLIRDYECGRGVVKKGFAEDKPVEQELSRREFGQEALWYGKAFLAGALTGVAWTEIFFTRRNREEDHDDIPWAVQGQEVRGKKGNLKREYDRYFSGEVENLPAHRRFGSEDGVGVRRTRPLTGGK